MCGINARSCTHTCTQNCLLRVFWGQVGKKYSGQGSCTKLPSECGWIIPLVKFCMWWKVLMCFMCGWCFFLTFLSSWENQAVKPEVVTDHSRTQQLEVSGQAQPVTDAMLEEGQGRMTFTHTHTHTHGQQKKCKGDWGEKIHKENSVCSKLCYIVSPINHCFSSVCVCMCVVLFVLLHVAYMWWWWCREL